MSTPLVGIVVLNWNRLGLIKKCLQSVEKQSYPAFQTFVIDNGSTDGSVEWLQSLGDRIHATYNPKNRGFAPAIDQGIAAALDHGCTYVVALNNDAVLDPSWLKAMVAYMEAHPKCGFAQGASMQADHKARFDSTGIYLERGFIPRQRASDSTDPMLDTPVIGPNAAASLYRADMLHAVAHKHGEYFDKRFFAYVEDVDFNVRCTMRGYQCGFVPKAVMHHVGSATGNTIARKKMFWGARNMIWMVYKNASWKLLRMTGKKIIVSHLANLQYLWRDQRILFWPYLWGLAVGVLGIPLFWPRRRQNLKAATLTAEQFFNLMVPSNPPLSNPLKKLKSLIR